MTVSENGIKGKVKQTIFDRLEGWFDKTLSDLPSDKQELVKRVLPHSGLWDDMDTEQRQRATRLWDYQRDPKKLGEQQRDFDQGFYEEGERIQKLIPLELNALKREMEREERKKERGKKTIARRNKKNAQANRPRLSTKRISDSDLIKIVEEIWEKNPALEERNITSKVLERLKNDLEVKISRPTLRSRLLDLKIIKKKTSDR